MHTNQVYSEPVTENNGPHKWWHRRWVKITGISVIVLIVFAVILALVLIFVVFAPKKSETIITVTTSSSVPVTLTTTSPQTTAMTTTQQSEWSVTGNMNTARLLHTASILPNGKVLITGGTPNAYIYLNSAELYDPSTGIWASTGSMTNARDSHTASVLSNGNVLVTGGADDSGVLNSAELYDHLVHYSYCQ
ncbi:unnamed protein product [Adineta steineri]|uniref:Uncharacterized protein n=1 Tax=Adineta steineri TaxID=433720 RepID=A0A816DLI9_9BILA|nr:unnamed protein product [Adineta steineri]CAF1638969.1 unnamed protein product [Adineta steineri]